MLDVLLWNKMARIVLQLAETLGVDNDCALRLFYRTETCSMLHDPNLGLHLMSDTYIVDNVIAELKRDGLMPKQ